MNAVEQYGTARTGQLWDPAVILQMHFVTAIINVAATNQANWSKFEPAIVEKGNEEEQVKGAQLTQSLSNVLC